MQFIDLGAQRRKLEPQLKKAIDQKTYGQVKSANFRRLASLPPGAFYADGKQSGGAILDLHIHDVDFVQYCFGMPVPMMPTPMVFPARQLR